MHLWSVSVYLEMKMIMKIFMCRTVWSFHFEKKGYHATEESVTHDTQTHHLLSARPQLDLHH